MSTFGDTNQNNSNLLGSISNTSDSNQGQISTAQLPQNPQAQDLSNPKNPYGYVQFMLQVNAINQYYGTNILATDPSQTGIVNPNPNKIKGNNPTNT